MRVSRVFALHPTLKRLSRGLFMVKTRSASNEARAECPQIAEVKWDLRSYVHGSTFSKADLMETERSFKSIR